MALYGVGRKSVHSGETALQSPSTITQLEHLAHLRTSPFEPEIEKGFLRGLESRYGVQA